MTLEDLNSASKLRKLVFSLELFILKRPHEFVWRLGRWVAGDTYLSSLTFRVAFWLQAAKKRNTPEELMHTHGCAWVMHAPESSTYMYSCP